MENIERDFLKNRLAVFEDLVRKHFAFLETEFGFKSLPVERSDNNHIIIRYHSKNVFLNLFYGHPGYELDFSFGRIGIDDQANKNCFTSGDLLYLEECNKWSGYTVYSAHSYDNLLKCLPKLANLLKDCGKELLLGNPTLYAKISSERSRNSEGIEREQIKKKAALAWKKRNYMELIRLLNPIRKLLSPLEKKRFDYSLKKWSGQK